MKPHRAIRAFLPLFAVASVACSSSSTPLASTLSTDAGGAGADAAEAAGDAGQSADAGQVAAADYDAGPQTFDCFTNSEWTAVGFSHYKNVLGHTAEMLAVAESTDGGTFPVGTVVQLNPQEAMVKRGSGFNATSNDWEFFKLDATDAGTTITARGGGASVSNAAGTCLSCHVPAQAQWDLICGDVPDGGTKTAHGCAPLPVSNAVLAAIQDPSCQ